MAEIGSQTQKIAPDTKVGRINLYGPGLYIVATPIGNLKDFSERAKETLQSVDLIACEDTRTSSTLLRAYLINTPLVSYHDHSGDRARERILETISGGGSVALISDAGTPLISDPGYRLVAEARNVGLRVFPVPGPSAVTAALSISGLPTDRFLFMGFAPTKTAARQSWFEAAKATPATLVFYESARRLADSLADAAYTLGGRQAAVCRELTKKFEEVRNGSLESLAEYYQESGPPKGEIVVIIAPPDKTEEQSNDDLDRMIIAALKHMSVKSTSSFVAELTGRRKKEVYERALSLSSDASGQ